MAHTYLTSANVATFNKTDMDLLINDVLDAAPLLSRMAARTVKGYTFIYNRQSANPAVGFRAVNDGIETTVATRAQVTATLAVLDASFAVDIAAAQCDERGAAHLMAEEAMSHLRQAMREVEEQIIYGTGNDATGFAGLATLAAYAQSNDDLVVNAGGSTASTGSSAWLMRTGPSNLEVLWGQDGVISIGDQQIVERAGSATGNFPAYYVPICAWTGLKIGSTYSAVRIGNLTEDAGKGLTDDLIAAAIAKFPVDAMPNLIAMNRRSWKQLQNSRTATNPTGAPAPFPADAFGIPIVVTDSILSTETILTT
jgi:hypothetical protein